MTVVNAPSGGLVVLGLFSKNWEIRDSLQAFRSLARRFFSAGHSAFPSLARLRSYARCVISDSCYRAEALNETLKDNFGECLRMFDYPEGGTSRYKLAVTTTTTARASTRLITNYNGTSWRKLDCGM